MARFRHIDRTATAITAGFAAIWIAAAFLANDTTFHLGPMIVAGAAPAVAPWPPGRAVVISLTGAVAAGALLLATGRLDGPSLLPWGDATLESAVGAVIGLIGGVIISRLLGATGRSRGGLGATEPPR